MSGLSGYDAWKTAAPDYPEWSAYVEVENGSIVLSLEDGSDPDDYRSEAPARIEIGDLGCDGETAEADDARILEEIKTWLRNQMYVTDFMCSSSVDFPEEYGVASSRNINIRALLAEALAR